MNRVYACIDLKSFYASVECTLRGLDPLRTNLVVADSSRTDKTICLAVSPSLKQYGIGGRARLFEVKQKVKDINKDRRKVLFHDFNGASCDDAELKKNRYLKLDFIIATPQMKQYMEYSTNIYKIYLKFFSKEDIYVYSIDECFIDITNYLKMYKMESKELITKVIKTIEKETGITATGGVGTNLYLAKVAMDIVAKHMSANSDGVRIASLNEMSYRKVLWEHRPLTDFWRVGKGISKKLEENGMLTMGDVALYSLKNENLLFKLFGVNAELLIDHAWGYEPCTMKDIKKFKPKTKSISTGQVLHEPYNYEKAKLIIIEMSESLTLDLVKKNYVTDEIVLNIGYDALSIDSKYDGKITKDFYGRFVPKPAHGSLKLSHKTSSTKYITEKVLELYKKIVNPNLYIRRINIAAINLEDTYDNKNERIYQQMNLFGSNDNLENEIKSEKEERKMQETIINIKSKFGKNALLKGMNLKDGSTTIERNNEIGGHRA